MEADTDARDPPQLYELRLVTHKGYGLFANQPIKRGTRIFAEAPLISLPSNEHNVSLWKQIEALTPVQHVQYTELVSHRHSISPSQRNAIRARLANVHQYSGRLLDAATEDAVKMHAIYQTNAVSMGTNGRHGHGLFLTYSRINHDCLQNVVNSYNATIGKLTVHAVRDIAAGEELVTSYVLACRPKELRKKALAEWGFECHCDACDGASADSSEQRRRRMFMIDQGFALFERDGISVANAPYPVPKDAAEALRWAEKLVGLLKEEGLVGMDLAQAYRECSTYSLSSGQILQAQDYAKKELEIEEICLGKDTQHLDEEETSVRHWMKTLEKEKEKLSEQEKVKMRMNEKRGAKEQKKADKKAAKKASKGGR